MKEKKTQSIPKQLFALAFVLIVLVAGSYAWLTLTIDKTNTNVLRAGTLSLVLDDTTSEGIKLEKAVPISDEKGKTGTEYTFTLQNEGTKPADYTIYLDDLELTSSEKRMEDSKVKYQLIKNGNEKISLLSNLRDKVLDSGSIGKDTTNTYSLRVWIDGEVGNEVMGTVISKQLRVSAEQVRTTAMCRRAKILHREICTNTDANYFCQADGYSIGSEIEYGSLGTKGVLTSGDTFDCDVNGDGVYDPDTERFYYVSDVTNGITTDNNTAALIYYNNVSGGVPNNTKAYAYDSTNENWHGPQTAVAQLPTTSQWKTTLTKTQRQITNNNSTTTTTGGDLPVFSYEGYAARFLTLQEVRLGCGSNLPTWKAGELSTKCKYLMENTKYSNASNGSYGEWLENPRADSSDNAWIVFGDYRYVNFHNAPYTGALGVRPAIEVAKTNIDY